jgi:eukaryotic-like serine/threonine-protein kinase
MSAAPKSDVATSFEDEKLAHALISRGLITRAEWQEARPPEAVGNPTLILARLVQNGHLTLNQAQRLKGELATITAQQIPGYQILEKLGEGATGTVFKARQLSMDRLVAIKRLHPKLAANKDFLERFLREAHLAAKFSSNNVIQAIDVGQAGGIHYFVMEYVEGVTIKDELSTGKIYEEKEAVEIVLQIAQALQHAHRRNLIHRDIKPANIVLTKDGIAKLADLGMARVTGDQAAAPQEKGAQGTPYYMAPEQIRNRKDIDSRVDIYALGATLFHMVTGRPPFPYPTTREVLRAHLEEELTPPDHLNTKLSSGLGEVVEFMMAKSRRKRYASPDELIVDLECLLHDEPPKFARQNMAASLESLAHGEAEAEEEEEEEDDGKPQMVPLTWALIMMGILALSCVGNLFLLLRGRGE